MNDSNMKNVNMNKHAMHMGSSTNDNKIYAMFYLELVIEFAVMYLAMYTMINNISDFYLNLNNVYMTLMMAAPMALIMLYFMRRMYTNKSKNIAIIIAGVLLFALGWFGMRQQLLIHDKQFLRSMIPHHSGAILMCREAKITDAELIALCKGIITNQDNEITQMKQILKRLEAE